MKNGASKKLACDLWKYFNNKEWDKARELLKVDFEAVWPQSREKIIGADNFIDLNRNYPGTHEIKVLNCDHTYDQWDKIDKVVTQVKIHSKMPDGKNLDLYAISFFNIFDGKITNAVEYWADTYSAPKWREKYVEHY